VSVSLIISNEGSENADQFENTEPEIDLTQYKRTCIPPTANGNVDRLKLKIAIAKGGLEMENYITEG